MEEFRATSTNFSTKNVVSLAYYTDVTTFFHEPVHGECPLGNSLFGSPSASHDSRLRSCI